ncbi:MAG: amidohydrolase [Candidatus Thermoplasmatota archaeon]|jgi:5-methylthioadenosine/S-adenosylhomocysteine deaminase|nr:amidohydrolase [Candidatus Thermoplasmatota archaeon]
MTDLLIRNALGLDGKRWTISVERDRITRIVEGSKGPGGADIEIDAEHLLVMPGLCNAHTHAPMSLLRGVGEDMDLGRWLNERIWPLEARMGDRHLKAGMALGCLEMVRTGTTLFNDMYFREGMLARTVADAGLRAVLGEGFMDLNDEGKREEAIERTLASCKVIERLRDPRINGAIAPHSVYTVSKEGLEWCADEARSRACSLHVHLSETASEVKDCIARWGRSPTALLADLGALGQRTVAAHCVHLSPEDIGLLSSTGTSVSHQPSSNMKLSVGGQLPYPSLKASGTRCCLGTDSAASNNSLDMFLAMRAASHLCRHGWGAASITTREVLDMATVNGYRALGLDGGEIRVGALADIILLDTGHHSMVPGNDLVSNAVHSASGDAVRYSIINGKVVMDDGKVMNEAEVKREAAMMALDLLGGDLDG